MEDFTEENRIEFFYSRANNILPQTDEVVRHAPSIYTNMIESFKDRKIIQMPHNYNDSYIRKMVKKFDNGFILYEDNEIEGVIFLLQMPYSLDVIISVVADSQIKIIKLLKKVIKFSKDRGIYNLISYILPFNGLIQTFINCGFEIEEEMKDEIEISSIKMVKKLK